MGIFGALDAANVSSNPYFVEGGEYVTEVTEAIYKTNKDQERQLFIEFTINDPESQYNKFKLQKYHTLVEEGMTLEKFEMLPAAEKKTIQLRMSNLKKDLCGSDTNSNQKGLGVNPDDLNDPNWDPSVLKGIRAVVGVANGGKDNTYVNVRWMNKIDE